MGTWLTLWLSKLGAQVVGYSEELKSENHIIHNLIKQGKVKQILHDLNDSTHFTSCLSDTKPSHVYHLAAQPLVHTSYEKPVLTFQTNVMGTIYVLDAVRKNTNVESLVIVTSDKCYDNKEVDYAYKETDPMGGYDPYSASKGAAEIVVSSYRNSFFAEPDSTQISTARAGNIIGGSDWSQDRLVPDCVIALQNEVPIKIRNPNYIRPWQFVLEPLSGMLMLSEKMKEQPHKFARAWNFGPLESTKKVKVQNLVELIIKEWDSGEWLNVQSNTNTFHEAKYLMLDSSDAINLLDWKPIYTTEEAVSETISWYKHFFNSDDVFEFSSQQLEKYTNKARSMIKLKNLQI